MGKFYCIFCEDWHTKGEKFGPVQKDFELGTGEEAELIDAYICEECGSVRYDGLRESIEYAFGENEKKIELPKKDVFIENINTFIGSYGWVSYIEIGFAEKELTLAEKLEQYAKILADLSGAGEANVYFVWDGIEEPYGRASDFWN